MRWAPVLMTVAFLATGCGGEDYPETYPVTGVVTYQGSPVQGADVVLVPSNPDVRSAGGYTDAEGKFSVKTYFSPEHHVEGAMSGEYGVTVSMMEKREIPPDLKPEEVMAYHMKLGPPKSLLPKKYSAPNTSGFKVSVGDAPPEPLKLELTN